MLSDTQFAFMTALELREMIAARQISPVELVDWTLDRIDGLNPKLNAFLTVMAEEARQSARAAEHAVMKGDQLGPLHGIPMSIKDLEPVKDVVFTSGSLVCKNDIADRDALCTERLRRAGAIIIGKTNTPEFGNSGTTENRLGDACRNPWNLERTSGGSSGGAAASVAAGITPIAQGSDGGGSIRIPASFCGIYGIKPTQGRVPRREAGLASWNPMNMSCVGPMSWTVADAAAMLQVMSGPAPGAEPGTIEEPPPDFTAALSRGVKDLRIGWSPDLGGVAVDPEVLQIAGEAARVFEKLGALVEAAEFNAGKDNDLYETFSLIFCLKAYAVHGDLLDARADLLTSYFRENLESGRRVTGKQYLEATCRLNRFKDYVDNFFANHDLLLTPTLAVPAFRIDDHPEIIGGRTVPHRLWGYTPFTYLFNMTGNPAANVPCGFSADGLPVGLQIVGRRRDEETVLAASAAFEEAHPWSEARPPMSLC